jgi:tRNA 2-thiouridine synthesizing protein A
LLEIRQNRFLATIKLLEWRCLLLSEPHYLDTKGLICPEPVMLLHRAIRKILAGELLTVEATDPSSMRDIPKFCMHLGHVLQSHQAIPASSKDSKIVYRFEIIKGGQEIKQS